MDDLCVHSKDRSNHIKHLIMIFEKCRVYQICLNPDKCVFMVRQGKILGHIVSKNGISTDFEKIKIIVELPRPRNPKQVQEFMGHCGYYRWFIKNFLVIVSSMTNLLKKNVEFVWSEECQRSMDELKRRLTTAPVLMLPDDDSDFVVYSDASQRGMGCVLMQNERVVSYISR